MRMDAKTRGEWMRALQAAYGEIDFMAAGSGELSRFYTLWFNEVQFGGEGRMV